MTVRLLRGSYNDEDIGSLNDGKTSFLKDDIIHLPQSKYDAYMKVGYRVPNPQKPGQFVPEGTPVRTRVPDHTLWFERVHD